MATDLPPPLEVYLLGLIDFDEAQLLQQRLVYDLGESEAAGALVLCEHPPTISIGRSGSRAHIVADDEELKRLGISPASSMLTWRWTFPGPAWISGHTSTACTRPSSTCWPSST
jgi:hypothetical protein